MKVRAALIGQARQQRLGGGDVLQFERQRHAHGRTSLRSERAHIERSGSCLGRICGSCRSRHGDGEQCTDRERKTR
jgi:hypothetical protein